MRMAAECGRRDCELPMSSAAVFSSSGRVGARFPPVFKQTNNGQIDNHATFLLHDPRCRHKDKELYTGTYSNELGARSRFSVVSVPKFLTQFIFFLHRTKLCYLLYFPDNFNTIQESQNPTPDSIFYARIR